MGFIRKALFVVTAPVGGVISAKNLESKRQQTARRIMEAAEASAPESAAESARNRMNRQVAEEWQRRHDAASGRLVCECCQKYEAAHLARPCLVCGHDLFSWRSS